MCAIRLVEFHHVQLADADAGVRKKPARSLVCQVRSALFRSVHLARSFGGDENAEAFRCCRSCSFIRLVHACICMGTGWASRRRVDCRPIAKCERQAINRKHTWP